MPVVTMLIVGLVVLAVVAAVTTTALVLTQRQRAQAEAALAEARTTYERRAESLGEREERLEETRRSLEQRSAALDDRSAALAAAEAAVTAQQEQQRRALEEERRTLEEERAVRLAELAELTPADARAQVLARAEQETRTEVARRARDLERLATEEAEWRARRVLATVVQRMASSVTADAVTTAFTLASDDVKGRIIGREGRNIRAFEQVTGVSLVVDDAPRTVVLSCFDPVRREVARRTLEELVADGRIHPTRIEEVHGRAERDVEEHCRQVARDACLEVGVDDLHPELFATLGRLAFRTSYGQNVLHHLVESAHAARLLAGELGLDPTLVTRAAFLHDIGKAMTHDTEGSHALVGADLARRCGEHPDVVHAIEAHHNEVEPRTIEAFLVQAADAVSGGRPGARREATEDFQQRLRRLEALALEHEGVERAYAVSAGRDLRVLVLPDKYDDLGAAELARTLVKQIEAELTYPGQVAVTVIRESRTTEIAR